MPVRDARSLERAKRPALDVNGFELVEKSLRRAEIGCLDGREAVRHSNPQYGGGNREVTARIMWWPSITMSGPSPTTHRGRTAGSAATSHGPRGLRADRQ